MSGGSYNYLCWKEARDLFESTTELEQMSERLATLGWASDAAAETDELILIIRAATNRVDARIKRLSPVWHAVEWWDSGDSGEDHLREELSKYRGGSHPESEPTP